MALKTYMEYKDEPVTQQDLQCVSVFLFCSLCFSLASAAFGFIVVILYSIATIAFGFIVGFICWSISTAWSQTHKFSVYTVLIWSEIVVCWIFAVICWLYLIGTIQHSFAFFFAILTCWALQVQFLLQIICSRIAILWGDRRNQAMLKYGVAAGITAINISVYCIWVPARLQVSERYIKINEVWDRCEKCIYLVVDALLNYLFIRTKQLVANGLDRYRPLVRFNSRLILLSISMDVFIIGMMSLRNTFVYMGIHPVAYLVKLQLTSFLPVFFPFLAFNRHLLRGFSRAAKIEMTMSDLIVDISTAKPSRSALTKAWKDGLQIAVQTQTTTTAVQIVDDLAGSEPMRTTRTPARPDLQSRLEKMRRERKERKEAAQQATSNGDIRIDMGRSRRGSETSYDDEKIEMDDVESWDPDVARLPRDSHAGAGVRFVLSDDTDAKR
ncbi:hypothetical protein Rt10032_c04g1862 [Rhodotorula toruloides]|uniref:Uncharacterized protein n=1 Tax=Rhodotorula toruloides TaxID=5286 RepID=A0A511KCY8_RHOTO|nr:hypothetical protein Rt10032_c04g1862 [Rhodotorula toruloides]